MAGGLLSLAGRLGGAAVSDAAGGDLAGAAGDLLGGVIRKSFTSEAISGLEWDPGTGDLTLTFARGGESYIFSGVPRGVVDGFDSAPSVGAYYHAVVKGRF